MKYVFLTLITALTLLTAPLQAAENVAAPDITVQVQGMVCDFCAQSIMKVFERETGLPHENIDISLDTQKIFLRLPEGLEITDEQIEKFIYYAGYDLVEIVRG